MVGHLSEIFVSFQGEGAHVGRRHLFVRLAGCNLRCRYCDTPDSLERTTTYTVFNHTESPATYPNPVDAALLHGLISTILGEEAPIDAIALTGGEPLTQSKFLGALLGQRRFPVPVLLETNGMLPANLREVLPLIDIISMDLKLPSNTGERALWDEHAQFLEVTRGKDLYVKILVDDSTAAADVERAAAMLAPIRPTPPTFMQPITDDAGKSLIHGEQLTRLYARARQHLEQIRVLPQTHKLLGIR